MFKMESGKEEAPDEKDRSDLEEPEKHSSELRLLDTSETKELEKVVEARVLETKDFSENGENIIEDVVDQDPLLMVKDVEQEEADTSLFACKSESKGSIEENRIPEENVESDISVDKLVEELTEKLVETDFEAQNSEATEESIAQPAETSAAVADDKIVDREIIENSSENIVGEPAEQSDVDRMDITEEKDSSITNQTESKESQMKENKEKESTSSEVPHERSSTPDDLIDMLKKLSPEKLQAIRSQIVTSVKESTSADNPPTEAMDIDCHETIPVIKKESNPVTAPCGPKIFESKNDDCIICLDSDDEEAASLKATVKAQPLDSNSIIKEENRKRQTDDLHDETEAEGNKKKIPRKKKDCINPECTGNSNDFRECDRFVLNFFFIAKKENRQQFVCEVCFDKAIIKYEEMGTALLNRQPMISISLRKKHEMIEVIDSDDEDEPEDIPIIPESEKIRFNEEDEKLTEELLRSIFKKVDIGMQMRIQQEDLKARCAKNKLAHDDLQNELKLLDKKSFEMYNSLYAINKPTIQELPAVMIPDVEFIPAAYKPTTAPKASNADIQAAVESLEKNKSVILQRAPASNQKVVMYPEITKQLITPTESCYYANQQDSRSINRMQCWKPCQKLEYNSMTKLYKVKFFEGPSNEVFVTGKNLALNKVNYRLKIGARVVAQLRESTNKISKFFPGVIGEKLSDYNKQRYLVFCDYGQVQYVKPDSVREVADYSVDNVWEDVHQNLRTFIKDYLMSQTLHQRALLNVRLNQYVTTERNKWFRTAQVVEIDCSIMRMFFVNEGVHEWLYRGSKRLQPIFKKDANRSLNTNARRVNPNISYTTIDEEEPQPQGAQPESSRNIAKKSTGGAPGGRPQQQSSQNQQQPIQNQQQPTQNKQQPTQNQQPQQSAPIKILNDTQIYLDEPKQIMKHKHFTPKASIKPKKYVAHECSSACLPPLTNSLSVYSPLSKPLLTCWERQIVRHKSSKFVMYKAPCGRRLRDMYEVRIYLLTTKCFLNVDNFDFDPNIQVLFHYDVIDKNECPLYIPDMTEGMEAMKIPVVNAFDDQPPPKLKYSNVRIPMQGVSINTDPAFMACCDCEDDCADKTKCACFQLTIQGYKFAHRGMEYDEGEVSYRWKRLPMQVPTGIYECHSGCHCTNRCLNKVVQLPIQIKMQLYRTKDRGWGLECNHDIPKGTFICIYAGHLYREDEANALATGADHGDEYYAELDVIETASQTKEGYEAGVEYGSDSEEEKGSDSDSDYDHSQILEEPDSSFVPTSRRNVRERGIMTRSTGGITRNAPQHKPNDSDDSYSDNEIVNMEPSVGNAHGNAPRKSRISLRRLYGKNERPYVMDARTVGNVGRYFNHSCDPNLFVQSVFVDTHDMRFPWIAFFANRAIKAGEELTWNYNYEVGSVPSKILNCKCGSRNCRGRIL